MIDLTLALSFISPIIVIACLCVGFVIKHAIPNEKINHFIPLIVMVLGIILNFWATGLITLEAAVAGGVSGLASTGLYEAFAQLIHFNNFENNEEEKEEEPIKGEHIAKE